jgi:hypothetical protein
METNIVAMAHAAAAAASNASNSAALNTIVVAIFGFLGVLVTTIGAIFLGRINANSKGTKEMAAEAVAISQSNGRKADSIHETTLQIHQMVNRPLGVALQTAATALETVAAMSDNQSHRQAAITARRISEEHDKSMASFEDARMKMEVAKAAVLAHDILEKEKLKNNPLPI